MAASTETLSWLACPECRNSRVLSCGFIFHGAADHRNLPFYSGRIVARGTAVFLRATDRLSDALRLVRQRVYIYGRREDQLRKYFRDARRVRVQPGGSYRRRTSRTEECVSVYH